MLQLFDRAKETNMYQKKSRRLRLQIPACFIFLVLFSKNHSFVEKSNPTEKNVIVEEELDCIDIYCDQLGKHNFSCNIFYYRINMRRQETFF